MKDNNKNFITNIFVAIMVFYFFITSLVLFSVPYVVTLARPDLKPESIVNPINNLFVGFTIFTVIYTILIYLLHELNIIQIVMNKIKFGKTKQEDAKIVEQEPKEDKSVKQEPVKEKEQIDIIETKKEEAVEQAAVIIPDVSQIKEQLRLELKEEIIDQYKREQEKLQLQETLAQSDKAREEEQKILNDLIIEKNPKAWRSIPHKAHDDAKKEYDYKEIQELFPGDEEEVKPLKEEDLFK